jgi:hypothetical protein
MNVLCLGVEPGMHDAGSLFFLRNQIYLPSGQWASGRFGRSGHENARPNPLLTRNLPLPRFDRLSRWKSIVPFFTGRTVG